METPPIRPIEEVVAIDDATEFAIALSDLVCRRAYTLGFDALSPADRLALAKILERREPDFFAALTRYIYMGYYTDPTVPSHFGLSAKPPHPYGYEVPDESPEELTALVEPVKKRGRCYQKC